jgi:hypothetical protein
MTEGQVHLTGGFQPLQTVPILPFKLPAFQQVRLLLPASASRQEIMPAKAGLFLPDAC